MYTVTEENHTAHTAGAKTLVPIIYGLPQTIASSSPVVSTIQAMHGCTSTSWRVSSSSLLCSCWRAESFVLLTSSWHWRSWEEPEHSVDITWCHM